MGKHKYGEPYTTEQVEDVKAFYGILKVSLGLTFFLDLLCDSVLHYYTLHVSYEYPYASSGEEKNVVDRLKPFLLHDGLLSTVLVILGIPIYILFIRPFLNQYKPNMLKNGYWFSSKNNVSSMYINYGY